MFSHKFGDFKLRHRHRKASVSAACPTCRALPLEPVAWVTERDNRTAKDGPIDPPTVFHAIINSFLQLSQAKKTSQKKKPPCPPIMLAAFQFPLATALPAPNPINAVVVDLFSDAACHIPAGGRNVWDNTCAPTSGFQSYRITFRGSHGQTLKAYSRN